MRFKGAQTSDNGAKAYPFETVDNLSLGETVRLDRGGRFCTGVIKLDNYYRPATMQILSLSITIGDRAVEGRLAEGDIEGPEHNTLELWAEFNFSKPFDNTMSRFMSDQAEEIFGTDRKIASKMEHPEKEKEKKPSQVKIKAAKSR